MTAIQRRVLLATLVNYSFNFVFGLLGALLLQISHLSQKQVALTLAFGFAASGVMQPIFGRLIDRNKIGASMLIAIFGNAFGVWSLLSESQAIILLGVFLFLISAGIIQTITAHLIEGLSLPENLRAMALKNYVAGNVGYAISALLAMALLKEHQTFLLTLDVISTFICCAVLWISLNRIVKRDLISKQESSVRGLGGIRGVSALRLGLAVVSAVGLYLAMAMPFSALPILYKENGLDPMIFTSIVIGTNALTVVAFTYLSKYIALQLFVRTVVAAILIAVGIGVQPLVDSPLLCLMSTVLWSTGEALVIGDISSVFFMQFERHQAGLAAGMKVFSMRCAFFLCPFVVWLVNPQGPKQYVLTWGVPTLISGVVLYFTLRRLIAEASRVAVK